MPHHIMQQRETLPPPRSGYPLKEASCTIRQLNNYRMRVASRPEASLSGVMNWRKRGGQTLPEERPASRARDDVRGAREDPPSSRWPLWDRPGRNHRATMSDGTKIPHLVRNSTWTSSYENSCSGDHPERRSVRDDRGGHGNLATDLHTTRADPGNHTGLIGRARYGRRCRGHRPNSAIGHRQCRDGRCTSTNSTEISVIPRRTNQPHTSPTAPRDGLRVSCLRPLRLGQKPIWPATDERANSPWRLD